MGPLAGLERTARVDGSTLRRPEKRLSAPDYQGHEARWAAAEGVQPEEPGGLKGGPPGPPGAQGRIKPKKKKISSPDYQGHEARWAGDMRV